MSVKQVKVNIKPDSSGEFKIHYECEGFVGTECDGIAEIMAQLGTVQDTKPTDDAYQHEIPVPVPNQQRG